MIVEVIATTPRSITLEVRNGEPFQSAWLHRALVDGHEVLTTHDNVFVLRALQPSTRYAISVESNGLALALEATTREESFLVDVRHSCDRRRRHDDTAALQAAIACCPHAEACRASRELAQRSSVLKSAAFELARDAVLRPARHRPLPLLPATIGSADATNERVLGTWRVSLRAACKPRQPDRRARRGHSRRRRDRWQCRLRHVVEPAEDAVRRLASTHPANCTLYGRLRRRHHVAQLSRVDRARVAKRGHCHQRDPRRGAARFAEHRRHQSGIVRARSHHRRARIDWRRLHRHQVGKAQSGRTATTREPGHSRFELPDGKRPRRSRDRLGNGRRRVLGARARLRVPWNDRGFSVKTRRGRGRAAIVRWRARAERGDGERGRRSSSKASTGAIPTVRAARR